MTSCNHNNISDSQIDDENEAIDNLFLLVLLSYRRRLHRARPLPSQRTWTGQDVVENLLHCNRPTRIHDVLRMNLDTFYHLRNWLSLNTNLGGSEYGSRRLSIEEKLMIFIFIASSNASNRATQERFNRSGSVISE
jgi:hypothetical protein